MKLKVQAQHLQPGDIVGSGEKVIGVIRASIRLDSNKVWVQLEKGDIMRQPCWGKYTMISVEREDAKANGQDRSSSKQSSRYPAQPTRNCSFSWCIGVSQAEEGNKCFVSIESAIWRTMMDKFYCEECGDEISEEDEGICDACALEQYDDSEEDEE